LVVLLAILALALGCGGDPNHGAGAGAGGQPGGGGGAGDRASAGASGLTARPTVAGLHAIDSGSSAELAPLHAAVGDARILALGESVHTSGGYAEVKARIVRHLIEEQGFRVLALETPRADARAIGDYLASCEGSLHAAMNAIFWIFADEHMESLLEWICAFNRAHPGDPVAFIGFDIQQPWHDGPALVEFLDALPLPGAKELAQPIAGCDGVDAASADAYYGAGGFEQPITPDQYADCAGATSAIESFFETHAGAIELEVGSRALSLARLALVGLSAWEDSKYFLAFDPAAAHQARDSAMATVLLETLSLDHPESRAVMWAHNFHVRHSSESSVSYPMGVSSTGTKLRQELGSKFRALGLLSSLTETNWPAVTCGKLPGPGPNDLESVLEQVGPQALFVDLADPELTLVRPGESYGFGLNAGGDVAVPGEQFQGLIWLAESPAMTSVFGPTSCEP
jgi:erythromycin esterase